MSDSDTQREITLEEWCGRLHEGHLVNKELRELQRRVDALTEAMQEFCDRRDRGEVRSTRTYNKFKALLEPPTDKSGGSDA